ncbi:MAG: type I-E CRISPR-associated protein Cse1/CasA, partial [Rhodospirillales bacterium]
QTMQYGIKYEGWVHPLSPHYAKKGEMPSSVKGNPGGVSYRHWLGLVVASGNEKDKRLPSQAIATAIRLAETPYFEDAPERLRLLAFGFDMDNMKARCWYQSEMPLPLLPTGIDRKEFETRTAQMVQAADLAAGLVRNAIKQALFKRPGDAAGDFSNYSERFWRGSEQVFFDHLNRLAKNPGDETIRQDWKTCLTKTAKAQFEATIPTLGIEDGPMGNTTNSKGHPIFPAVEAYRFLLYKLDSGLEKELELPSPERKKKSKKEAA